MPLARYATETTSRRSRLWPWRACAVLTLALRPVEYLTVRNNPHVADTSPSAGATSSALACEDRREAPATRVVGILRQAYPTLQATIGDALSSCVASPLPVARVHGKRLRIASGSLARPGVLLLPMPCVLASGRSDRLPLSDCALRAGRFDDAAEGWIVEPRNDDANVGRHAGDDEARRACAAVA